MTIPGSLVKSCGDLLRPDGTRTVLRPFHITDPAREGDVDGRTARIIDRVMSKAVGSRTRASAVSSMTVARSIIVAP